MRAVSDEDRFFLPNLAEKIFRKNGYAAILPNFEYRPEQEKMAFACAQAFSADSNLLFEAGTGVGKSLAYLIPGIIAASRWNRQLVVATHTIALQRQIIEKDLPRVRMMFSNCDALSDCAGFKSAILLGRANYLCSHRLKRTLAEKRELFNTEETAELERIAEWAAFTQTGLMDELNPSPNPEVWSWVNADSSSCTPKNCADGTCFYQRARKEVASADLVVLNHSLLFALLSAGLGVESSSPGVLFPNDMLVLDEAHLIPDVASEAFGISLSGYGVMRELMRIYNPRKKRGLITREGMAEHFDKQVVSDAIAAMENFFAQIRKDFLIERDTVRLSSPNWADESALSHLDCVARLLDTFAQNAKSDRLCAEFRDYRRKIAGIKNSLEDCIYLGDSDSVYWLESSGDAKRGVRVNSAPIDVAPILRRHLFSRESPVVLTSATLAISGKMDGFVERVGAEGAEKFICASPFDFNSNMRAFLSTDSPEPDKDTKKLDCSCLCSSIEKLCARVAGGTLVLFTSYADLNKAAKVLENSELLRGRKILVQGRMPRGQTIMEFSDDGNAILLGTDTFWTGIDVPGQALSQVIIARLPFENISHPLLEARMDRALALGENPFQKISLPSAVIKFRQGIGRLIRSARDKGLIVVLDSRIISKPYGRSFIDGIPTNRVERFNSKNIDSIIVPELEELGILNLES